MTASLSAPLNDNILVKKKPWYMWQSTYDSELIALDDLLFGDNESQARATAKEFLDMEMETEDTPTREFDEIYTAQQFCAVICLQFHENIKNTYGRGKSGESELKKDRTANRVRIYRWLENNNNNSTVRALMEASIFSLNNKHLARPKDMSA